jgi:hypothetical protein
MQKVDWMYIVRVVVIAFMSFIMTWAVIIISVLKLTQRETEQVVALLLPIPHLMYLWKPLNWALWTYGTIQIIAYSCIVSIRRLPVVGAIAVVVILHVIGVVVHLSVRGLVP